jgi:hypothetical protein
MSKMSRPSGEHNRSAAVALWRDALYGTTEIDIPDDASAILLNLSVEYREEWTADGRGDNRASGYPVLAGWHPIYGK